MNIHIGQQNEFYKEKPSTIFCDIDGTILKHVHVFSDINKLKTELNPGVIEKFNEWDSIGHKIILVTARKESARAMTEKQLSDMGISWDYLLMGVTSGRRILINDKLLESDPNRALAINTITNNGFKDINWKEVGL